jgi:Flp pilus assembly secretin CpaC
LVNIEDGQQEAQQVDRIPVVTRSVINTQALLRPQESVLIGGLVREATVDNATKVPLLGDIPIIKHAFRYESKSTERVERLFLISPRLSVRTMDKQTIETQLSGGVNSEPQYVTESERLTDINNSKDNLVALKSPAPKYPRKARKLGIEGFCVVEFKVGKNGKARAAKARECSDPVFRRASEIAANRHR